MWIGRLFLAIDYLKSPVYFSTLVIKGSRLVLDPALRVTYDIAKEVVVVPALSSLGAFEKIVAESAGLKGTSLPKTEWLDPIISPTTRSMMVSRLGDLFAIIGHFVHKQLAIIYHSNREWSMRVLASESLSSRMTTVAVGYGFVAFLMGVVALNPAGVSSNAGQVVLQSIQRHSQFIKVSLSLCPRVDSPCARVLTISLLSSCLSNWQYSQ